MATGGLEPGTSRYEVKVLKAMLYHCTSTLNIHYLLFDKPSLRVTYNVKLATQSPQDSFSLFFQIKAGPFQLEKSM